MYTSSWTGFYLPTLVVIRTGSCKSNYNKFTTMTPLIQFQMNWDSKILQIVSLKRGHPLIRPLYFFNAQELALEEGNYCILQNDECEILR